MKFESQVLSRDEPPGASAFGNQTRRLARGSSSRLEDVDDEPPHVPSRLISHGRDPDVEIVDERPAKSKP
eukprot:4984579-Karenia_brevis.AAC.1